MFRFAQNIGYSARPGFGLCAVFSTQTSCSQPKAAAHLYDTPGSFGKSSCSVPAAADPRSPHHSDGLSLLCGVTSTRKSLLTELIWLLRALSERPASSCRRTPPTPAACLHSNPACPADTAGTPCKDKTTHCTQLGPSPHEAHGSCVGCSRSALPTVPCSPALALAPLAPQLCGTPG